MKDLVKAAERIKDFEGGSLKERIRKLEEEYRGVNKRKSQILCDENEIDDTLLYSAITLKKAFGQVNVVIHAIGVILLLPKILDRGEVVQELSLGAGSTGSEFDLKTNLRIAEFKFINWKGGSESMRQNSLFKDFFYLAEKRAKKKRCLYVLGLEHPLKFLNSERDINNVLGRYAWLSRDFKKKKYDNRFSTVSEYYNYRKKRVEIIDINDIMPSFASSFP